MARITNQKVFDATPCTCFKIDPKGKETPANLLCYSEGAIGVLSDRQDVTCKHQIILPTPPDLEFHMQKFALMGNILQHCMKENDEDRFYVCIKNQTIKQGLTTPPPAKKPKKPEVDKPEKPEATVRGHAKFKEGKLVTPKKK